MSPVGAGDPNRPHAPAPAAPNEKGPVPEGTGQPTHRKQTPMSDNTPTLATSKAMVLLLEEAMNAGLPLPSTAEADRNEVVSLAFDHLDHVRAWGEWLDVTVIHDSGHYIRHTFAARRFGVVVRGVASVITRPEVGV